MLKKICLLFFPSCLFAFDQSPYFYQAFEFQFRPSYSYRYYPSVANGQNPSSYHSHDQFLNLNLQLNLLGRWDVQAETTFTHTNKVSWNTQSAALQLRYLILDDVSGDPVTLTVGGNARWVLTQNLYDVSCPYHANGNFEINTAIGKEFDRYYRLLYRIYGFLAVGQGNRGALYLKPRFNVHCNFSNQHLIDVFAKGYFGFGNQNSVDISRFHGYANIHHQSIDIGLSYSYLFRIWGALTFEYAFRPYAKAFPQYASTFTVAYRLPFSLL